MFRDARNVLPGVCFPAQEPPLQRNLRGGGLGAGVDVVDVGGCRGAAASGLPRGCAYARLDARRRDAQPVPGSLRWLSLRSAITGHPLRAWEGQTRGI